MKAFISYSHKDVAALERLHAHLAMLRRDDLIQQWFDRDILAGGIVDSEIDERLEGSDLFLLLVSPDFLNSDYCYNREMTRALERHHDGSARVVPIVIEPCEWKASPLGRLKAVPRDGLAVSEWTNENNAYLDITQELRRIVERDAIGTSNGESVRIPNAERGVVRRYRIKRDFDEIDRSEFRDTAFGIVRDYFERATAEISGIEGLRGRFISLSPNAFSCTIVNRARDRGTAHITFHSGARSFGDLSYSFAERAPPTSANGIFNIEADDYDLFLAGGSFGFGGDEERRSPHDAAEWLWTKFLQQAGVEID